MHAWEAIQLSIDEIETRIKEEIQIESLAQTAHLSLYYYQRLFSRLVGKPVMEYCKARKLAHAKLELRETKKRILDIALDFGFTSHETFTKSFKELYGITPESYRKGTMVLTDFLKPDLLLHYTVVEEGVPLIVDDMILEIRNVTLTQEEVYTGVRKDCDATEMNKVGENTLIELWTQFHNKKASIPNLTKDGVEVDYFTYANEEGKVTYFVGGESQGCLPSYPHIKMEVGRYYVCSFEAESFEYLVTQALYKANQYFFETWLPSRGISMMDMEPFLVQKYVNVSNEPTIEVWIKPKNQG